MSGIFKNTVRSGEPLYAYLSWSIVVTSWIQ